MLFIFDFVFLHLNDSQSYHPIGNFAPLKLLWMYPHLSLLFRRSLFCLSASKTINPYMTKYREKIVENSWNLNQDVCKFGLFHAQLLSSNGLTSSLQVFFVEMKTTWGDDFHQLWGTHQDTLQKLHPIMHFDVMLGRPWLTKVSKSGKNWGLKFSQSEHPKDGNEMVMRQWNAATISRHLHCLAGQFKKTCAQDQCCKATKYL